MGGSKVYRSSVFSVTSGSNFVLTHSLGVMPDAVIVYTRQDPSYTWQISVDDKYNGGVQGAAIMATSSIIQVTFGDWVPNGDCAGWVYLSCTSSANTSGQA